MRSLAALALLLAVSVAATAQIDPAPDGIGVYFDLGGMDHCIHTAAPYESVTAYLLITNPHPDIASILSWEAQVEVLGDVLAPSWTLAGGEDSDPSPLLFSVVFEPSPLIPPAGPTFLLATWTGIVPQPTDVVHFQVGPVPGSPTFPDSPGYVADGPVPQLHPLTVSAGSRFYINFCTTPAEDATFTGLKALFR